MNDRDAWVEDVKRWVRSRQQTRQLPANAARPDTIRHDDHEGGFGLSADHVRAWRGAQQAGRVGRPGCVRSVA